MQNNKIANAIGIKRRSKCFAELLCCKLRRTGKSWQEKEKYYKENKHLFEVDPASEIEQNGLQVAKNIKGIVLNVEENSLDIIDLYKLIELQNKKIEQLDKEISILKMQIEQTNNK